MIRRGRVTNFLVLQDTCYAGYLESASTYLQLDILDLSSRGPAVASTIPDQEGHPHPTTEWLEHWTGGMHDFELRKRLS